MKTVLKKHVLVWMVVLLGLSGQVCASSKKAVSGAKTVAAQTRQIPTSPVPPLSDIDKRLLQENVMWAPVPSWAPEKLNNSVSSDQVRYGNLRVFMPLYDQYDHVNEKDSATYIRQQLMAQESAAVQFVSEVELIYNPAYQRLKLHGIKVIRNGLAQDRSRETRIEILRREQQLDKRIIDGLKTALLVVPDVRAGDVLETEYSIEGSNPIFEGKLAKLVHTAMLTPVGSFRYTLNMPLNRSIHQQPLAGADVLTSETSGDRRIYKILKEKIPVLEVEDGTPPWFKVYPAIHISEYADWLQVHQWAQHLFKAQALDPVLVQLSQQIRAEGLPPKQEVLRVLALVQEQVRYFSASLGESSHRPKPPGLTWSEKLGDCKDKVVLLNSLLTQLGYRPEAVLVSITRNKAMLKVLPTTAEFDHVISRVEVAGQTYVLDPTVTEQGGELDRMAQLSYGAGLVVGSGRGVEPLPLPAQVVDSIAFEQSWDFAQKVKPHVPVNVSIQFSGAMAESVRRARSSGTISQWVKNVQNGYEKSYLGLKSAQTPNWTDDRVKNTITFTQGFEYHGGFKYFEGRFQHDLVAHELFDFIQLPREAQRRMPWWLNQSKDISYRLRISTPYPMRLSASPERNLGDGHVEVWTSMTNQDQWLESFWRIRHIKDEVLPEHFSVFRDKMVEVRKGLARNFRLALWDQQGQRESLTASVAKLQNKYAKPSDRLNRLMFDYETDLILGQLALPNVVQYPKLRADVLHSMAVAASGLGQAEKGLTHLNEALQADPLAQNRLLNDRFSALLSLGRLDDAKKLLDDVPVESEPDKSDYWPALVDHYTHNNERALRRIAFHRQQVSDGEAREFAKIWHFLIAEAQTKGSGAHLFNEDELEDHPNSGFARLILRHLVGKMSQDQLLAAAKKNPGMERLDLTEAYFFIGKKWALQGQRQAALEWFKKIKPLEATPYREFSLARLELARLPP